MLAKETLHGDANCAGAHTQSSLSSFDHALRLDYAALLGGFGFPVVTKRRTKRFLRTFLSPRVPVYVFRLVRQTAFLPLCTLEQPYFGRTIALREDRAVIQACGLLHLAEDPTATPVRPPQGTLHARRRYIERPKFRLDFLHFALL